MEIYQGKQVAGFPLGKEEIKRSGGGKNLCYQYELMITHLSLPVTNVQIYIMYNVHVIYVYISCYKYVAVCLSLHTHVGSSAH